MHCTLGLSCATVNDECGGQRGFASDGLRKNPGYKQKSWTVQATPSASCVCIVHIRNRLVYRLWGSVKHTFGLSLFLNYPAPSPPPPQFPALICGHVYLRYNHSFYGTTYREGFAKPLHWRNPLWRHPPLSGSRNVVTNYPLSKEFGWGMVEMVEMQTASWCLTSSCCCCCSYLHSTSPANFTILDSVTLSLLHVDCKLLSNTRNITYLLA